MRMSLAKIKNLRQLESVLLVCALVATSIVIVLPLSSPKAKGQVIHNLPGGAMQEDGAGPPYDLDPTPFVVRWDPNQDHIIATNYVIQPGFTLEIPALNYTPPYGNFGELRITFQIPGSRIDVLGNPGNPGRLITNDDGVNPNDYTAFLGTIPMFWDGIYFKQYSEGCIDNVYINHSQNGIVFEPGSNLISPGVSDSRLRTYTNQAMLLDGVLGYTNIQNTRFVGTTGTVGTGLVVKNCTLNLTGGIPGVRFEGHSPGEPGLNISDAEVFADGIVFDGNFIPGTCVYIEGGIEGKSNATVFSECNFQDGAAGDYYIEANGSSPLIVDCSFEQAGQLTIIANDNSSGVPAHPILRNPQNMMGGPFDNTTLSATGASSVTLQWYLDVYVIDPDTNPIAGSTVTVDGAIPGAPGMPSSMITASAPPAERGWARGFITTEFILYSSSVTNYNPYNVSADNGTAMGYAIPEVTMDMSKSIVVVVPFSITPNMPPSVFWIETPSGIQGGDITIQYILYDPNPGDNGSLSISLFSGPDNASWFPATPIGQTTNLENNTWLFITWDSSNDLPGQYQDPTYLQIVPSDPWATGTPDSTGNFIVDNEPPIIITMPELKDITNTTATINWTVDQPATASLWWGLDDTLTSETTGSTGSAEQSVTLTNLEPGRKYSYVANSTDQFGNWVSTYPMIIVFYTKVHIQLYKGWNMISIPPDIPDEKLDMVLASIAGEYDAVQRYNATDSGDHWKHYHIDKSFGNDLDTVDSTMGLWILMKNDAVLIPDQMVPETIWPAMSIRLEVGWNFVGYPSAITRTVIDALSSVATYDLVQTYDAASGKWLSYDQSIYPPEPDDLLVMEMGRGYWIHCTAPAMWNIDYA